MCCQCATRSHPTTLGNWHLPKLLQLCSHSLPYRRGTRLLQRLEAYNGEKRALCDDYFLHHGPAGEASSSRTKGRNVLDNAAVGMASTLVAGLLTQPADVIKTRMMTQAASTAVPYTSAFDCLTTILRTEGISTLDSGLRQRSTYMCLLWGMTFALNGRCFTHMRREQSP